MHLRTPSFSNSGVLDSVQKTWEFVCEVDDDVEQGTRLALQLVMIQLSLLLFFTKKYAQLYPAGHPA